MLPIRTDFQHSDPSLPISPLGLQMLGVLPHIQNLQQILKAKCCVCNFCFLKERNGAQHICMGPYQAGPGGGPP